MNVFEILSEEKILAAHAFDVKKVQFRLPDGRQHAYDLVDHPNSVSLLPINAQGEVNLVTQYRIGAKTQLLELPAGVMNAGESPLETAHRELREEIGQDSDLLIHLGGFYLAPGYCNEYMSAFLALGLHPAPLEQDEDEFLEPSKLLLAEVFQRLWSREIQDGKTMATLLLALPEILRRFPSFATDLTKDMSF